jgi:hypothetical protein
MKRIVIASLTAVMAAGTFAFAAMSSSDTIRTDEAAMTSSDTVNVAAMTSSNTVNMGAMTSSDTINMGAMTSSNTVNMGAMTSSDTSKMDVAANTKDPMSANDPMTYSSSTMKGQGSNQQWKSTGTTPSPTPGGY